MKSNIVTISFSSHFPTAKTLCCELQSVINALKKQEFPISKISFDKKVNRLSFYTGSDNNFITPFINEFIFKYPSDNEKGEEKFHMDLATDQELHMQIDILVSMKDFIGRILTSDKENSPIKNIEILNNSLVFSFEQIQKQKTTNPSSKPDDLLLLVDGSNLLARAYHATAHNRKGNLMTNQEGLYTNGVLIFARKLMKMIQKFKATHVCVCWDVSRDQTFRRKLYPLYKALRKETDPELKEQFSTAAEMLTMMNIPQLKIDQYEADDIIGTLIAKWKQKKQGRSVIYSNDHDLHQLLDKEETVHQIINKNREEYLFSASQFKKEYGIDTDQWIDVKALLGETGSSSDNIPGVKGVGDKAAFPLIQCYGTLENLYRNIDELPENYNRYVGKLVKAKSEAFLSQKLAKIVTDIPDLMDFDLEELNFKIDHEGVNKVEKWLDFRHIA